jgi:hypothetical protein
VLYLRSLPEMPAHALWLQQDDAVSFRECDAAEIEDEDRGTDSWNRLQAILPTILDYVFTTIKVRIAMLFVCCWFCVMSRGSAHGFDGFFMFENNGFACFQCDIVYFNFIPFAARRVLQRLLSRLS